MVKCEGSGSATGDGLDFFNTEKKASVHYVPCKIACANCRSPLFDEVRRAPIIPSPLVLMRTCMIRVNRNITMQGRNTVICYPSGFQFGGDNPMPEDFKAKCHIFYGSRSVDMPDGLPKWAGHKDGSKLIPEIAQSEESVSQRSAPCSPHSLC